MLNIIRSKITNIKSRPEVLKLIRNMAWLFFDNFFRIAVGLLLGVWVARHLGPASFGQLSYVTAYVGIFAVGVGLGLQNVVIRDVLRKQDKKEEILGTAIALQIIAGVVIYASMICIVTFYGNESSLIKYLILILGVTLTLKFTDVITYWFESQVESRYIVFVQNGAFAIFSLIKIMLIILDMDVIAFVVTMLMEALLISVCLIYVFHKHALKIRNLKVKIEMARLLIRNSWPLLLTSIFLIIQARVDQIFLAEIIGVSELAYYSVALRIIETAAMVTMILKSTFMPSICEAQNHNKAMYEKKLIEFSKINSLIGILICVILAIFSDHIVLMLFGNDFAPAGALMSLMTVRLFFAHIGVSRSIYLLNDNLLLYSAISMFVCMLINLTANYILIPRHGAIGAAWASIISFPIAIVLDLIYKKTRRNALLVFKSSIFFGHQ